MKDLRFWSVVLGVRAGNELVSGHEAHAVQHILIARGWEKFIDAGRIIMPGRLLLPQRQLVPEALGTGREVLAGPPVLAVLAPTQHVVKLEKLNQALPVILHAVVEAPGNHGHDFPIDRELLADHARRLLDQCQGRGLQRLDEPT